MRGRFTLMKPPWTENGKRMSEPVHIYSAESQVLHLPKVLREMWKGLGKSRYIAYRLTLRDIRGEYSKSAFGMVWDLLDPLVLGTIFYFLKRGGVFNLPEIHMSYSVYIVYGMLIYQSFNDAVLRSVNLIVGSKNLLTHLKMPPEALILSVFFRVGFDSLFRIAVMLLFSLVAGDFSLPGFILFVAAYPGIILAGLALGVLLAPFNAIYLDVGRLVRVILVPLRYASPVLWPIPKEIFHGLLLYLNPIAMILINMRLLATSFMLEDAMVTAVHCVFFLVLGLVGWFIFHVSIPVLAEGA